MRYNLSKTKRRPRSNKKGALKGLHNNKTKVVKKRRIEQRGGGTLPELIHYIQTDPNGVSDYIRLKIEPSLYNQFVAMNSGNGRMVQITGPTALYTACSLLQPNPNLVNTLLFFGFKPDTPNNDDSGSFPQHGVVEAAGAIIRSQDHKSSKNQKLEKLVNVLGLLRNYGARMEYLNKQSVTAMGKYNERISGNPSIYEGIYGISQELSKNIYDLLSPETPYVHPPHPSVYADQPPQGALPPCDLLELPDSYNYNTEPNKDVKSKYYFTYNRKNYYFCANINWLIDSTFRDTAQAGKPGSTNSFNVTYSGTTFTFSYKHAHLSSVGGALPAPPEGPQHVSFNIEDHRCRIDDADVGMLPQSN
jgi:hypothetical protein